MTNDQYTTEDATQELLRISKWPEPLRLAYLLEKEMLWPLHGKAADCLRSLHEELEATNRQVEILSDALAESRRGIAALKGVQEPVAWMHTMIEDVVVGHRPADLNVHPDRWMPLYKDPTPCQTCEALARTVMMDQTAHDTTPPAAQRQWVGLTDEEMYLNCPNWLSQEHCKTWLQQIEAKLKEKNT
jgi:hypothetical protein